MKIKDIKIGDRFREDFGDIGALAESIKENGLIHPPTVNKKGELIAGLRRIKACERLGWKDIEVRVLDLDNIIRGEFDENVLRKDFTPVEKVKIIDALLPKEQELALERKLAGASDNLSEGQKGEAKEKASKKVGWSRMTYEKAKKVVDSAEESPDEYDDLKKKLDQSVSSAYNELERREDIRERKEKIKELLELKNLFLGDCLKKVDKIENNSIDSIITDPPYGGHGKTWGRTRTLELREDWNVEGNTDEIFGVIDALLGKVDVKLKPDASIYIFTNWRQFSPLKSVVERHYDVKNCLIWDKGIATLGELQGYNYKNTYEVVLFAGKGKRKLNYSNDKNPTNLLKFDRVSNRKHPAEKPVDLLKKLISHSTIKGETILDSFAGSGSTLVAAELLDRNWIGIEIEKRWYDIARERIEKIRNE